MIRRYFGTDGVRGRFGEEPITPAFAEKLGRTLIHVLGGRPRVAVARDTRHSGPILEDALVRGLTAAGADVQLLGILPTPAVPAHVIAESLDIGIVISASHNPAQDNGIKFFQSDGFKLSDETEARLEAALDHPAAPETLPGIVTAVGNAVEHYVSHALHSLPPEFSLRGLRITVDCANGSACAATPLALRRLGAEVDVYHATPDDEEINAGCGSTVPEEIRRLVRETKAQVGLAHDGDADRLLLCDETGQTLDGDEILAMTGLELLRRGELPHRTLVATVMSNLALDELLEVHGGKVVRAGVGDRYVIEAMRAGGYTFGGEQSGHIAFLQHGTTGDGLVAALQIFRIMIESGKPLSELRRVLSKHPQAQRTVRVKAKPPLESLPAVRETLRAAEKALHPRGRVFVRYSGTEMKARILLEGPEAALLENHANQIAAAFQDAVGV